MASLTRMQPMVMNPCEINENQRHPDKTGAGAVSHSGKQFTNHVILLDQPNIGLKSCSFFVCYEGKMSTPHGAEKRIDRFLKPTGSLVIIRPFCLWCSMGEITPSQPTARKRNAMGLFSFITDLFSIIGQKLNRRRKKRLPKNPPPRSRTRPIPSRAPKKRLPRTTCCQEERRPRGSAVKDFGLSLSGKGTKKTKEDPGRFRRIPLTPMLWASASPSRERMSAPRNVNAIRIKVDGLTVLVKRLGQAVSRSRISVPPGLGSPLKNPALKAGSNWRWI